MVNFWWNGEGFLLVLKKYCLKNMFFFMIFFLEIWSGNYEMVVMIYYDYDVDFFFLKDKIIVILGYGL